VIPHEWTKDRPPTLAFQLSGCTPLHLDQRCEYSVTQAS
jgi:hypothetical protein